MVYVSYVEYLRDSIAVIWALFFLFFVSSIGEVVWNRCEEWVPEKCRPRRGTVLVEDFVGEARLRGLLPGWRFVGKGMGLRMCV